MFGSPFTSVKRLLPSPGKMTATAPFNTPVMADMAPDRPEAVVVVLGGLLGPSVVAGGAKAGLSLLTVGLGFGALVVARVVVVMGTKAGLSVWLETPEKREMESFEKTEKSRSFGTNTLPKSTSNSWHQTGSVSITSSLLKDLRMMGALTSS